MLAEFLQFLFAGITIGAIYALVGLGFAIIYNASHVINFAQGEFLMIGGMTAAAMIGAGAPMGIAVLAALVVAGFVGGAVYKLAVEPAGDASVVTLIIITIGTSIFIRGLAQIVWGKEFHALPSFSGDDPIELGGATMLPQSLWVLGTTVLIVLALAWFFRRTLLGKAILATSYNPDAAKMVGIDTRFVLLVAFVLSAVLGAVAGIMVAPITFTSYDIGIMLGLKGFAAAVLGGLGSGVGAVVGGLILGITESMTAGYLSSEYKDAVPFVVILMILFIKPSGLFGAFGTERV